jgi:RNA polymerase sigma factor (sigma-70 family)
MASGEARWFETLYESSYQRLTLIVLARSDVNLTDAQEIVQEAFATAYGKRRTLETVGNPEAWVCTVALNIARRRWRRRRIADRLMTRDRTPPTADGADVGAQHADLYRAIRALPPGQREAVFLHHLADLSVQEISARTGNPIGTIKSRLARGRATLADQLAAPPNQAQPDPSQPTREGTPTP